MGYRNKTYVIFDGDNDVWAYANMKGWNESEHIEFDFYDAHDLRPLTDRANEDTVRGRLRQRLANSSSPSCSSEKARAVCNKFVRWEIETALDLDFPIIGVKLKLGDAELRPTQLGASPLRRALDGLAVECCSPVMSYDAFTSPANGATSTSFATLLRQATTGRVMHREGVARARRPSARWHHDVAACA